MAPKKKGGGGKKSKGPAICTEDEACAPFGLKAHDIVRTPLGLLGTVIGVKYEDPNAKDSGRLWVRYENGHEAPLEPRQGAGHIAALGYRRCAEADHIRRDVGVQEVEIQKQEEQRRVVQEVIRLKAEGLPIPEHLIPAPKEAADKKDKGKDKKAKK